MRPYLFFKFFGRRIRAFLMFKNAQGKGVRNMAEIKNDLTPGMEAWLIPNPSNGMQELVLKIMNWNPGQYHTWLGTVDLVEVNLTPKSSEYRYTCKAQQNYLLNEGIDGSSGRVKLDIRELGVQIPWYSHIRQVEIHGKGIGCQILNANTRLWIDLGMRITEPSRWSRKPERWVPVQRP